MKPLVHFRDLGLSDFKDCWDYQEELLAGATKVKIRNKQDGLNLLPENNLLFVEHPHVYTLGKSGTGNNLLVSESELDAMQAKFYKINRGGDITYHGPGQLVGYPVFDLEQFFTDIHKYMRFLEEAVIRALADWGINSGRFSGYTGVWIEPESEKEARKICAMGVKCSRWITMHGFALNVNPDMDYFEHIVPCGIREKAVTSMKQELGYAPEMEKVKASVLYHLAEVFEFDLSQDSERYPG